MAKLITVFSATGNTGRSVALSLLADPSFVPRAVTRNPDSDRAKELSDLGIETVKADLYDTDSIRSALAGSYGCFLNTDTVPEEAELGKKAIDIAAQIGVKHFVYASLHRADDLQCYSPERLSVFQNKYEIQEYARMKKELVSVTMVSPGWFLENASIPIYREVFGGFPGISDEEGRITLRVPHWGNDPEVCAFSAIADDYGDIVRGVLLDPERWNRAFVQAVSHPTSFTHLVEAYNQATGSTARVKYLDRPTDLVFQKDKSTEAVCQGMFMMLEERGGKYYGEETSTRDAEILKREAVKALGQDPDTEGKLMTVDGFFSKYFGAEK